VTSRSPTSAASRPGVATLVIGRKLMEAESGHRAGVCGRQDAGVDSPGPPAALANLRPDGGRAGGGGARRDPLVDPERPIPPEITSAVEQYAAFLARTLPPQVVEQLTVFVRRLAASYGGDTAALSAALPRWARAAYLTTIRAGLLLAGDLEIAARLAQASAVAVGIDSGDVLRDLCAWSVSESYFDLRAQLGLRTVNLGYAGG
jgi:hypothetical protein